MSNNTINRITISKPSVPNIFKDNNLATRLSRATQLLDKNNFPELGFSVHYNIDEKPTVVLVGKYKSSQDQDLFRFLDSKEFRNVLPESVVVEWMYTDSNSPNTTVLATYPQY